MVIHHIIYVQPVPAKWIEMRGAIEWPPRSPDLSPLDFYSATVQQIKKMYQSKNYISSFILVNTIFRKLKTYRHICRMPQGGASAMRNLHLFCISEGRLVYQWQISSDIEQFIFLSKKLHLLDTAQVLTHQ